MTSLVFTYGTLKQGFSNFHVNGGRRVAGDYETVSRFPLHVIGHHCIPWLVDREGAGHHVLGELFEVDAATLARMDALERIGQPGWYVRRFIRVRLLAAAPAVEADALVYFGAASRLDTDTVHAGPLRSFTADWDAMYRSRAV